MTLPKGPTEKLVNTATSRLNKRPHCCRIEGKYVSQHSGNSMMDCAGVKETNAREVSNALGRILK